MSSTPQDGSSGAEPASASEPGTAPTGDDEPAAEAESEDLEAQLDMVATRSPI